MNTLIQQEFQPFFDACRRLHDNLVPGSMVILVLSFGFFFWTRPQHPMDLIKFLVKLFLVVLLVQSTESLINWGQSTVDQFVEHNVPARPDHIASRYAERVLGPVDGGGAQDRSWWDVLTGASLFESILYAAIVGISWIAVSVLKLVYALQQLSLHFCWVLSPLLFACFAIPPLSSIAYRHFLRMTGIILWPIGFALAATVTECLLGLESPSPHDSVVRSVYRPDLTNPFLIGLGFWVIFSTLLAPAFIQRLVTGFAGSSSALLEQWGERALRMGRFHLSSVLPHRPAFSPRLIGLDESLSPHDPANNSKHILAKVDPIVPGHSVDATTAPGDTTSDKAAEGPSNESAAPTSPGAEDKTNPTDTQPTNTATEPSPPASGETAPQQTTGEVPPESGSESPADSKENKPPKDDETPSTEQDPTKEPKK